MAGVTPNYAIPYAEGTDPRRNYPASVDEPAATIIDTELARLDRRLAGSLAIPSVSAGGNESIPVTFPPGFFSEVPVVVISTASGRHNCAVASLTVDGFNFLIDNWTAGNASASTGHWFAMEAT